MRAVDKTVSDVNPVDRHYVCGVGVQKTSWQVGGRPFFETSEKNVQVEGAGLQTLWVALTDYHCSWCRSYCGLSQMVCESQI